MSIFDWPAEPHVPRHLRALLREMLYHVDPAEAPIVEPGGEEWGEARHVSRGSLAKATRRSERQVGRQLRELVDLGFVRVVRRGGHQRDPSVYLVRWIELRNES